MWLISFLQKIVNCELIYDICLNICQQYDAKLVQSFFYILQF